MYEPVVIRIELQAMKQQILHAFASHGEEINAAIEQALTRAIDNFDVVAEVTPIVDAAIRNEIKAYFEYGPGRSAISKAVHEALENTLPKL